MEAGNLRGQYRKYWEVTHVKVEAKASTPNAKARVH